MQLRQRSPFIAGPSIIGILLCVVANQEAKAASLKDNVFRNEEPRQIVTYKHHQRQFIPTGTQSSIKRKTTEKYFIPTEMSKIDLVRKSLKPTFSSTIKSKSSERDIGLDIDDVTVPVPKSDDVTVSVPKSNMRDDADLSVESQMANTLIFRQGSTQGPKTYPTGNRNSRENVLQEQKYLKSEIAADLLQNADNSEKIMEPNNEIEVFRKNQTNSKVSSEIVSLRNKPAKFLAILKDAQESEDFEDPFSMSSFFQGAQHDKSIFTDSSAFSRRSKFFHPQIKKEESKEMQLKNSSPNFLSKIDHLKNTSSASRDEKGSRLKSPLESNITTLDANNSTSLPIDRNSIGKVANLSDTVKLLTHKSQKSFIDNFTSDSSEKHSSNKSDVPIPSNISNISMNFSNREILVKHSNEGITSGWGSSDKQTDLNSDFNSNKQSETWKNKYKGNNQKNDTIPIQKNDTIPIYEELTGILHVDTSIDDVQDYDIHLKSTENSDKVFPKINSSRTNLLDPGIISFKLETGSDHLLEENAVNRSSVSVQSIFQTKVIDLNNFVDDSVGKFHDDNDTNDEGVSSTGDKENAFSNGSKNKSLSTQFKKLLNESGMQILVDPDQAVTNKSTNFSNLNAAYSNFVKENTAERVRTSEVETGVDESESTNVGTHDNAMRKEDSKDTFFGYGTNWSATRTKNDSADPVLISDHNEKVLELQERRMLQVMNPAADPCDDFYEYACGKWSEVYPLQDKALDNTFDRLREGLDEVLRSLLQEEISEADNYATKAAKKLYNGCMKEDKIEDRGMLPLKAMLKDLGGWPVLEGKSWNDSAFDWVKQMATLRTYNNDILLSEWVAADITNSSYHIIQLDQPELGLPGREYFISSGDEVYRMAYMDLMLETCHFLGGDPKICFEDMLNLLQFEKQLAKILTPAEERRNLSAVSQRLTIGDLQSEIPEINWKAYLSIVAGESVSHVDEVIVFAMKYLKKLVSLVQSTRKRTVCNYLLWRFVKNRISNLGQEALKAKQEFIHVLFGSKSQPERWLSCVSYVNGNLGYVVGAMFVKRYYPQSSKNDSVEMIQLIRESFLNAIKNATWMAENTRKIAEEKVLAMVRNVGYPEYILDDKYMDLIHSDLVFNDSEHFFNVIKMLQFHARSTHKLLQKPVNRTEWTTTPAVVNAYYSRSKNMIMFPAGILQPPFYHPAFPRSLNFGGIGVVIGHEISHGFDDRGRQFDVQGNLQQWWTEEDVSHFYDRATCMLDQYGEYTVSSVGLRINAVNTLGENIADNAGLKIAYEAYQRWKKTNEEEVSRLRSINLTYDQLFFLNFGQIWCEVNSPEAMLTKIRGGQHSPNRYRVIGTLSNSEEFNEAFHCPKGAKMNRQEKCKVW